MMGIPIGPMGRTVPWDSHGNGNCEAKLMGIEMGMGIRLSHREWENPRMGILIFSEIPAPSDSYHF